MKYDLRAFLSNFARHPTFTLYENFVKLLFTLLYKLGNRVNNTSLVNQLVLLRKLFREDRFILIILDSCRYDVFANIVYRYLRGRLIKVWSPASHTHEWLLKVFTFPGFKITRIFSAHPAINSLGVQVRAIFFAGTKEFKATDFLPRENIIDIWRYEWDSCNCISNNT